MIFQEISSSAQHRLDHVLVFLAVTLLLLFVIWLGLYLSRRFTELLWRNAAATQRWRRNELRITVPA
jgi:hypothetical protein